MKIDDILTLGRMGFTKSEISFLIDHQQGTAVTNTQEHGATTQTISTADNGATTGTRQADASGETVQLSELLSVIQKQNMQDRYIDNVQKETTTDILTKLLEG